MPCSIEGLFLSVSYELASFGKVMSYIALIIKGAAFRFVIPMKKGIHGQFI